MARTGRNVDVAVKIDGLKDLRKNLKSIDSKAPRELNKAAKKVGQKVAAQAADYAPKDTGALANSIKVGSRGDKITVRSPLVYANPIHWGWPSRNIRESLFLTRAVESKRDEYLREIKETMDDVIRRYHLDP